MPTNTDAPLCARRTRPWPSRAQRTTSAWLQGFEEGEELVRRLVAAVWDVWWRGSVKCLFLQREVGVGVNLGGADVVVAQPQRDDGVVDAGVTQPHRGGVAQGMRSEVLVGQRRAA